MKTPPLWMCIFNAGGCISTFVEAKRSDSTQEQFREKTCATLRVFDKVLYGRGDCLRWGFLCLLTVLAILS